MSDYWSWSRGFDPWHFHNFIIYFYRNERGETGKKYKETGSGRVEIAGDFSVLVYPYLWERLKIDDESFGGIRKGNFIFEFGGGDIVHVCVFIEPDPVTSRIQITCEI